jgi:hypothetical protein
MEILKRICPNCNAGFETIYEQQIYCDISCRPTHHPTIPRRHCDNCGNTFKPARRHLSTCRECRKGPCPPPNSCYGPGYIYLIKGKRKGETIYKIGLTKHLKQRLNFFEHRYKFPIKLIHFIKTDSMKWAERDLHYQYKDKHVIFKTNGHNDIEWFRLNQKEVTEILSLHKLNEKDVLYGR